MIQGFIFLVYKYSCFFVIGWSFLLSSNAYSDEVASRTVVADKLVHQVTNFVEKKAKLDYENKLKSVQGLLNAHKRITDLNQDEVTELRLQKKVMPLIKRSKEFAESQHFKKALSSLNDVYFVVVDSIKSQRSGQTLIRSLDFATEKEAYEYELGRYKNYKMLVNMMIDERHAFNRDARSQPFFEEADRFYAEADKLVREGRYGEAAKRIEMASKSLVNLLRDTGIYIPGE